eukprot:CAMPEP_0177573962 /NCGR_PEP_ID=MMETSP0369-20130122/78802_1 /TAXON_ID=447022 ORGANISM="Scrippsiella hangoei-like, Strain SHHI-4" /NCGR_SAMPLE_ID=MMETSP0369 /ASSEMBLY_ACC=CAM_ASM_000364 /LENGTH=108 /DNA_ID=CAMNT_0019062099 /DNA_START=297 /DNA_END=624 /DNA_ORIENTATION=+
MVDVGGARRRIQAQRRQRRLARPAAWLDLTVGSAGLLALLAFGGSWRGDAAPSPVAVELASQAQRASDSQSASARDEESSDTTVPHTEANIDTWDFAMQCLVHSVAAA